jgi:hypothetical protein
MGSRQMETPSAARRGLGSSGLASWTWRLDLRCGPLALTRWLELSDGPLAVCRPRPFNLSSSSARRQRRACCASGGRADSGASTAPNQGARSRSGDSAQDAASSPRVPTAPTATAPARGGFLSGMSGLSSDHRLCRFEQKPGGQDRGDQ